ncbi:MAG: hypothetical protein RLZZ46_1153 [Bacteroidota bacterium]|jgi:ligand-binding sensor domain-containing protein/class 3 adenylate cyclase
MLRYLFLVLFLILFSCTRQKQEGYTNTQQPKVVEAKGYVVPKDSMAEPKVVLVDESKLKKIPVGKPKVVPTNTNVHPAGKGKVVLVDEAKLRIITPGTDTFSLPKTVPAIDSPFVTGIPEVNIAKDPYIKDQNPQNFSSFSKLQGLKHDAVRCMLQDKFGNLWFGSAGGGVSKYDGRYFTHFTEKEGLSNNVVCSILEDRSGNLWFGTWGGGVSKYDGKRFTHFSIKEGLSSNFINCILEDKSGNIWFGTYLGGVSKFDGKEFTYFSIKEGLYDIVVCMLEDKHGNLWFGTDGAGLFKLARSKSEGDEHYSFTHFTEKDGLCSNYILSALEDKSGDLWFGTFGGGVSKLKFKKVEGYDKFSFINYSETDGLVRNDVRSIIEDISGNIWFGTYGGGISRFDGIGFAPYTENEGLIKNVVYCILEDRSGNMWFGTNGGVSKYVPRGFSHFSLQDGSSHDVVYRILEDRSGNLWFGDEDGGASKYDGNRVEEMERLIKEGKPIPPQAQQGLKKENGKLVKSITHFTEKEGLSKNFVWSALEDSQGNFWFGTWGGGVSKFDGKSFFHFTEKEGLSNNYVLSILEDRSGNIWLGTNGGGVSKYDGKSFTHFTKKEGLAQDVVRSILEDKSGNLWFGTWGGGVSKLALNNLAGYGPYTFTNYSIQEGLSNNNITSMLEDRSGNLWFGTFGGGVSKLALSKVKGKDTYNFTHFTEKEGLSNNFVLSILEDISGNLWFGTRFGLSKLTSEKLLDLQQIYGNENGINKRQDYLFFKNFGYEDGFLGIGCNSNSIYQSKDGKIWIGANDRITVFRPEALLPDTQSPNIQLSGIDLFNESIPWSQLRSKQDSTLVLRNGMQVADYFFSEVSRWYNLPENLSLAYNNNYLTFKFIGINMSQPKRVNYQYKLEGMDENWSGLTSRNEATYGNLPHGTYTFLVKAMNSNGVWSKPFQYTFIIRPPWWKTWWAYSAYTFFIIGSVYSYIRWRERTLRARQKELEEKVDEATVVIRKEKERSDNLLLNILPAEVAEELKSKGSADAQQVDEVTVLFTDFKGFTQLSEKLSPKELVSEINECFSAFDHIMEKFGVEKIKTIGDAYMAAGGLPSANNTHAEDVVRAALEIQAYMHQHKAKKIAADELFFEIRIGVHTGPVVAGIVGVKKFQYDIWGDTVNTASRMESSGEVGKVNVSGSTYERIKNDFKCSYRGKIQAKGKGEIDMYFVEA